MQVVSAQPTSGSALCDHGQRAARHLRWRAADARRRLRHFVPEKVSATLPNGAYTYRRLGERGRLGNQLFQIAATIGIAREREARVLLPAGWPYRPYFSLPTDVFAGPIQLARSREAWPAAVSIEPQWRSYLQDYDLWAMVRDEVWRLLQPSDLAIGEANARLPELVELREKTAVHVRRGDYVEGRTIHRPCHPSYYERAVDEVLRRTPDTHLLVFSDDHAWVKSHLDLPAPIHIEGNPEWLDLTLMSLCDQHICANSTFSWWGAFLSTDPSPIIPFVPGTLPDFRRLCPAGWRLETA